MEFIKQRTKEWFEQRRFRVTGSMISNILSPKGLGDTGKSYLRSVVVEGLFGELEESFESYAMKRGTEIEPLAFSALKERLAVDFFVELNQCGFYKYGEYAGASPDGVTNDNGCAEIKCPGVASFFKVVETNYIDPKYYDQMQMEMMATNTERCYYFNYLTHEGREYGHLIVVPRDEVRIKLIDQRISQAAVEMDIMKLTIKKNKQF